MEIKVLGSGCANCVKLYDHVKKSLEESGKEADVVKVTEMSQIMSYGVMRTPALVIDGKVVSSGRIPAVDEIKGWI